MNLEHHWHNQTNRGQLVEELSDDPDLKEDAELIRQKQIVAAIFCTRWAGWVKMICT